jgi:uncharacterized protein (TIGR03118 family)
MNSWLARWRRPTGKTGWRRRAQLCLEPLEERFLLTTVGYSLVNMASDLPGLAEVTVPNLVNPWGISFSPTGPFWFADNQSGVANLLNGSGQVVPLTVTVPSPNASNSSPSGSVFNDGPGFAISANGITRPSLFLFAAEDGTISGWSTAVDPNAAVLAVDNSSLGADYTGLALATDGSGHSLLYAADFGRGEIDVFDQDFKPVERAGAFQDPNLPAGFAPFNIQNVDGKLFVSYAQQSTDNKGEDAPGAGLGFIDVYDANGTFLSRFASQGALNAPWGLALAPADFGRFGGALLVGNNGDGHINAYSPTSGAFLGQLPGDNGAPIAIPDLWALTFGNGHEGGDAQTLFFAAGIDQETHGLFGAIQSPQLRGTDTAGTGMFDPSAPGESGDYPLPPVSGPALASPRPPAHPTSVLLPLTESSLVLVPTLSTVSQPGTTSPIPANLPVATGSDTFGAAAVRSVTQATVAASSPESMIALTSFLDLRAAPCAGPEMFIVPPVNADALAANLSAYLGGNVPLIADLQLSKVEAGSSEIQEPPVRVSTNLPELEAAPKAFEPESSHANWNSWTKVGRFLLCVIATQVGLGYLLDPDRRKSDIRGSSPGLYDDQPRKDGSD